MNDDRTLRQAPVRWLLIALLVVLGSIFVAAATGTARAQAQPPLPQGFSSEFATVNGIRMHYVRGGSGEPLVLLHGFPQDWSMWAKVMPSLAERYTVIAPDLRGAGRSEAPPSGYDKATLARDIRGLVEQLQLPPINLVGHDIGLMVAYDYAASYPQDVRRLVLLEAPIPDESIFTFPALTANGPGAWWFGFFTTPGMPETLIRGREYPFVAEFFRNSSATPGAISASDLTRYAQNLSEPARLNAYMGYFRAFPQDVARVRTLAATPLRMPILAMGAEFSLGASVPTQVARYGTNVTPLVIAGSGHWIPEEKPTEFSAALLNFLQHEQ